MDKGRVCDRGAAVENGGGVHSYSHGLDGTGGDMAAAQWRGEGTDQEKFQGEAEGMGGSEIGEGANIRLLDRRRYQ